MRDLSPIAAIWVAVLVAPGCRSVDAPPPEPADLPVVSTFGPPPNPWSDRELPFEVSADDRPFLGTGFTGYAAVPAETGFTQGVRVAGVQDGHALAIAGMQDGDVIVEFGGEVLDGPQADLIQQLREILKPMAPDSLTSLAYWRKGAGVTDVELWLGRSPPFFASLATPADWFSSPPRTPWPQIDAWMEGALALDDGRARFDDTWTRQRDQFEKRDPFRLRETVQAQLNPTFQEALADTVIARLRDASAAAATIAAGNARDPSIHIGTSETTTWADEAHALAAALEPHAVWLREELADWSPEERVWLSENIGTLTDHVIAGANYIYGDDDVARERTNRKIMKLLERVDREGLARTATHIHALVEARLPSLRARAAESEQGLLAELDTDAGRIEIWGKGRQTHKTRCLLRIDLGGDDRYLDCAAGADLELPVSIDIDLEGHDIYGATAPFRQAGALGGVALLFDLAGDDQYLGRQWSQGAAVAGFALLVDRSGDDTYRGREASQGAALVGGAVLSDVEGRDVYTGDRFCQGVGFAAGVGALLDAGGDDRYACTGRYGSEYGEDGVFSGWGQGVGFGFRGVTSGGIGLLHDSAGDDVYEAGNFSQGGAYFFAWGVLRDDAGDDRYIGSRYAQGYAAHQAAGTFIEGAGDDLYQSHAGVAQGLSWDETSVFFHDHAGNDRYQTRGFSLASAAHNGMVIFVEGGGDDWYADLPAKASSNNYHGGHSFALFVDVAGDDTYAGKNSASWNGRAFWRHGGAYVLDLDGDRAIPELVRPEPVKD